MSIQIYAPSRPQEQPVYTPPSRSSHQKKDLPEKPRVILKDKLSSPDEEIYEALHLIVGRSMLNPEGGTGGNNNISSGKENTFSTASANKRSPISPKKPPYLSTATLLGVALITLFCLAFYAKRRVFPSLDGRVKSL